MSEGDVSTVPAETVNNSSSNNGKSLDDDPRSAEELKSQANEHFRKKEYEDAIQLYTKAIDKDPKNHILYGNRSFAYLKTECFGYAYLDASYAIELDKKYIKGYYRRAAAQMANGKFKEALKDFETVTKFCPRDQDAKAKYTECKKIVSQKAFEKAISVDTVKKSVAESIDFDSMTIDDSYDGPKMVDGKVTLEFMQQLIETFKNEKPLHRKYAYKIVLDCREIFSKSPTLVDITIPDDKKFTVCGDIHGQFYDLLNIFKLNGLPSEENPYLFNGDVVDRGSFSVECILVLFGFKLLYPNHLFIARGNHESETMNKIFGFEGEVKNKFSQQMYDLFAEVFEYLPLAHCLNDKVLVMHGGLFNKDNVTLEQIRQIDRVRQPPEEGLMCDILWSDPMANTGRSPSKRGVGVQFGPDVTENFLKTNKLDYIIRSHEVKETGYEIAHDGKCITVFSAPNYCDQMGNLGAFINFKGGDLKPQFTSFKEVPHPDKKPMCYSSNLFNFA
ncbi:PREDICTED: serine/threonine-protein phosphatase 5-like [Rhagoletis zephyria]|uniref:serine/threonine-protein phosphatase 5-like n=1 Tax=Rhagoletis zephyria TaxID=28612 RepID=UPI000811946D|nr:PREDICTED: serine/threonine-protein phosphatase 5-like [Rhagoletis zephyria]KAH9409796.1 Serine/threonine-protein phosphatase 5 [Tyrophagus putrescentiae]